MRVVYIEPRRDLTTVPAEIDAVFGAEPVHLYIPNKDGQRRLEDLLKTRENASQRQFLSFETINPPLDDRLYLWAMETSSYVAAQIRRAGGIDGHRYLTAHTQRAFAVEFHDLLVKAVRPIEHLRWALRGADVAHVYYVPEVNKWSATQSVLEHYFPAKVSTIGNHPERTVSVVRSALAVLKPVLRPSPIPIFDRAELNSAFGRSSGRPRVAFLINYDHRLYISTLMPLLAAMSGNHDIVILVGPHTSSDGRSEQELRATEKIRQLIKAGRIRILRRKAQNPRPQESTTDDIALLTRVGEKVRRTLEQEGELGPPYAMLVEDLFYLNALRIIARCHAVGAQAAQVMARCDAVLVAPGRLTDAILFAEAANVAAVPTFEVQNGFLSANHRFITPSAETMFVSDQLSQKIYSGFLGMEEGSVKIVGSPRIDYRLEQARKLSTAEARSKLGLSPEQARGELWVCATQPVGLDVMRSVVALVMAAIGRRAGALLLIKQHPDEDERYLELYEALARQNGLGDLLVRKEGDSALACVAADVVLTYFSSVGLEGFCLGRKSIAVNPFGTRPPFDLAELGVATEVADADQLLAVAGSRAAQLDDPETAVLRDGASAQRIAATIGEAIARRARDPGRQLARLQRPARLAYERWWRWVRRSRETLRRLAIVARTAWRGTRR